MTPGFIAFTVWFLFSAVCFMAGGITALLWLHCGLLLGLLIFIFWLFSKVAS